jgi:hypothetical protein
MGRQRQQPAQLEHWWAEKEVGQKSQRTAARNPKHILGQNSAEVMTSDVFCAKARTTAHERRAILSKCAYSNCKHTLHKQHHTLHGTNCQQAYPSKSIHLQQAA